MTQSDPDLPYEARFDARPSSLRAIRSAVYRACRAIGAENPCADDVVLAVDEACQNIIRHAYSGEPGEIRLRIERSDADLVVSLIDFAPHTDPRKIRGRELDDIKPGGLGTHLMRQVMDKVEFVEAPPDCGNMVRMTKRIG